MRSIIGDTLTPTLNINSIFSHPFARDNFTNFKNPLPLKSSQFLPKSDEDNKTEETQEIFNCGWADHLSNLEEICPPGGMKSIVLYTTSVRGIRKTFQDCQTVRFLLRSFSLVFIERDVSMHMVFRDELWSLMKRRVIPPVLFIMGRCVGGADEVVSLHEQGKLKKMVEGFLKNSLVDRFCRYCGSFGFLVCFTCYGSRKLFPENDAGDWVRCPECNENGLIQCPLCSI